MMLLAALAQELPMADSIKLDRLAGVFGAASIPTDNPGFDLHPNYLAAEKGNPRFLFNYGRFVHWRDYDPAYLARAERIIRTAAEEVHRGLRIQGLHGACIVTSMILQRILDRHGVWNCMVKGAFRAFKPDGSTIFGIYPLDRDAAQGKENGHVWLYAPPFQVVDVTLNLQEEDESVTSLLPDIVLAKEAQAESRVAIEEMFNPKLLEVMDERGYTPPFLLRKHLSHYESEIAKDFGAFIVPHRDVVLKYITTGFGGADGTLEKINGYTVHGKSAFEFYQSDIEPKLNALGAEAPGS